MPKVGAEFDLAIVGGGINGAGIARDAAGRGLRVVLLAASVGFLAGAIMAFTLPGLSWVVVLLAAGGTAYASATRRKDPFALVCTGLSALLVLPLMLLDNAGIATL